MQNSTRVVRGMVIEIKADKDKADGCRLKVLETLKGERVEQVEFYWYGPPAPVGGEVLACLRQYRPAEPWTAPYAWNCHEPMLLDGKTTYFSMRLEGPRDRQQILDRRGRR